MDVLQMMQRFVSPPCEDCLYHLGVVRCVVSPCPACLMTGIRPSFCGSCVFGRRSRRRDEGGEKRVKRTKCARASASSSRSTCATAAS